MNKENASQEISSKERRKSRRKTMDQILQTQITRRDEPIHKEQEQLTEQTSLPHDDQINVSDCGGKGILHKITFRTNVLYLKI